MAVGTRGREATAVGKYPTPWPPAASRQEGDLERVSTAKTKIRRPDRVMSHEPSASGVVHILERRAAAALLGKEETSSIALHRLRTKLGVGCCGTVYASERPYLKLLKVSASS